MTAPLPPMTAPALHDGYITDVDYPRHFHRETMPVWLAAVLTALGRRAPDLAQPYTWLELGCGSGLGVVTAAATNPLGQCIGIDVNPAAIAQAQALARAARVPNAHFHCLSFDALLHTPATHIPQCDFITTHGVYSWISAANRQALQHCVAQRLKPGGVLYLAYMSHPGAASFAAAQRLMHMATQQLPGSSADKARAATALLQKMARCGAGYFSEHPAARREVERMGQHNAQYLAHEFLNAHWHALHVADVMADYRAIGCEWAGSANPLDNIDAVSLPAASQPLLAELLRGGADAAQAETFKDIARNQNQRRDLYQRQPLEGSNLLAPDAHRAALLAQRVCLLPAAAQAQADAAASPHGTLTFDTRIGPVQLPLAQAAPLLQALRSGPCSYAALARLPAYAPQPGFISQLLQMLAWAGWLHFIRPDWPLQGPAPDAAAQRLNALLAQQAAPQGGPLQAVAAIGSAMPRR